MNGHYGLLPVPPSPPLFAPGGRLTLVTGTPVIASDQADKTAVYYTPHVHGYFPVVRNGILRPVYFGAADLALTLTSAHTANALFDVFGIDVAGKAYVATGPAWTTATAGSSARGTGGTELTRAAGILVNRYAMNGFNGSQSFSVQPLEATYLGTIYVDATAGQVTCHTGFGQNRKFGVWNAFNRVPTILRCGDATSSWTYNSATVRASNNKPSSWSSTAFNAGSGTACNGVTVLMGLAESPFEIVFTQYISSGAGTISTGINSITSASGMNGVMASASERTARNIQPPALGITTIACLEAVSTSSATYEGTNSNMLMTAEWAA